MPMKKTQKSIPLSTALTLTLGGLNTPVITKYQFSKTLYLLYVSRQYKEQAIKSLAEIPTTAMMARQLNGLLAQGILSESRRPSHKSLFTLLGKSDADPVEVLCSIDPFAYISHATAMEYHGLTDRFPKMFFISSPAPKKWREFAKDRMEKDLGEHFHNYIQDGFAKLTRLRLTKIDGRPINCYASVHSGAFKKVQGSAIRVSTIGRTFLDMLKKPDLCGGIYHVIDCYKEHASTYLRLIIDEVSDHGSKIDKIRAGYILEEFCSLQDPGIEAWQEFLQRGGSMKLDHTAEYSSTFSDRWNLSINIIQ